MSLTIDRFNIYDITDYAKFGEVTKVIRKSL